MMAAPMMLPMVCRQQQQQQQQLPQPSVVGRLRAVRRSGGSGRRWTEAREGREEQQSLSGMELSQVKREK
jgi:hypothetical protein